MYNSDGQAVVCCLIRVSQEHDQGTKLKTIKVASWSLLMARVSFCALCDGSTRFQVATHCMHVHDCIHLRVHSTRKETCGPGEFQYTKTNVGGI